MASRFSRGTATEPTWATARRPNSKTPHCAERRIFGLKVLTNLPPLLPLPELAVASVLFVHPFSAPIGRARPRWLVQMQTVASFRVPSEWHRRCARHLPPIAMTRRIDCVHPL